MTVNVKLLVNKHKFEWVVENKNKYFRALASSLSQNPEFKTKTFLRTEYKVQGRLLSSVRPKLDTDAKRSTLPLP